MKKLLLGLGAMMAVAAPVVVAVSCGDETEQGTTGNPGGQLSHQTESGVTVNYDSTGIKTIVVDFNNLGGIDPFTTLFGGSAGGQTSSPMLNGELLTAAKKVTLTEQMVTFNNFDTTKLPATLTEAEAKTQLVGAFNAFVASH